MTKAEQSSDGEDENPKSKLFIHGEVERRFAVLAREKKMNHSCYKFGLSRQQKFCHGAGTSDGHIFVGPGAL